MSHKKSKKLHKVGQLVVSEGSHLIGVDAVVDRPGGLEVLQHALFQLLGQAVHADEVFQILHARVVEGTARVHALDDGCHIPKHHCMHQRCG